MKKLDLSNVKEAGDFEKLVPGGYVCRYTNVEDKPDKEYLYMEYDIAEGKYKDYYKDLQESFKFWGGHVIRSYKEKARPMFKRMCSAVSKSNGAFVFDGGQQNSDEKTLIGKLVGIVLGEEEYPSNDGSIKIRLYVYSECSIADIRNGNFKVPELKKFKNSTANTSKSAQTADFVDVPGDATEECPFN